MEWSRSGCLYPLGGAIYTRFGGCKRGTNFDGPGYDQREIWYVAKPEALWHDTKRWQLVSQEHLLQERVVMRFVVFLAAEFRAPFTKTVGLLSVFTDKVMAWQYRHAHFRKLHLHSNSQRRSACRTATSFLALFGDVFARKEVCREGVLITHCSH